MVVTILECRVSHCALRPRISHSVYPLNYARGREHGINKVGPVGQPCCPVEGLYLVYIETILLYFVRAKSQSDFITLSCKYVIVTVS